MSIKFTCPVCDRSQIEGSICPNCETNLSTYGMLANLPIYKPVDKKSKKQIIPIWLPMGMAILFLLLGLGLGFASNSTIAKQQQQITPITTNFSSSQQNYTKEPTVLINNDEFIENKAEKSALQFCGGFQYVVRKGDYLSLIAYKFYGDINLWSLIREANPVIQNKENTIEIGELLFVPNLKTSCLN